MAAPASPTASFRFPPPAATASWCRTTPPRPASRGGTGFSQFFGLNDVFTAQAPSILATGLSASDASGLAAGGDIALSLKGPDGDIVKQVSVTTTAGMTIGNVVSALNTAHGRRGDLHPEQRRLDLHRQVALYPDYQLNVTGDTTQRGTTGISFTKLFGIGANNLANQAIGFAVTAAVANAPQRIGFGTPGITAATVAGDTIVTGGDNSGAIALQNVITADRNFSAAGGIAAQTRIPVRLCRGLLPAGFDPIERGHPEPDHPGRPAAGSPSAPWPPIPASIWTRN